MHRLMKMFGDKEDRLAGEWRFLHNEELHELYSSTNFIGVIKSCGACSAYGGLERCIQGFWWGDLRERYHLEDVGVDGRIILKWIFKKWDREA